MGKNAFTVAFPPQVRAISTVCKISDSYSFDLDADMEHPQYFECSAAWDTGAVMSVISHQMANRLNLNNMGFANMIHQSLRLCHYASQWRNFILIRYNQVARGRFYEGLRFYAGINR